MKPSIAALLRVSTDQLVRTLDAYLDWSASPSALLVLVAGLVALWLGGR